MKTKASRARAINGMSIISHYIVLIFLVVLFVYPILWLVGASFKVNSEIFSSLGFLPKTFTLEGYMYGWRGVGSNSFGIFFRN